MKKKEQPKGRWFWCHWQNLYTLEHGDAWLSGLRNGRAWFYFGNATLGVQWVLRKLRLGVGFSIGDGEHQLGGFLAIPFFSFYWYLEGVGALRKYLDAHNTRELSVRVFGGAVWWHIYSHPYEWKQGDSRWRSGSFHFVDFLFGRGIYTRTPGQTVPITIPMPEHEYTGTASFFEQSWKRQRLPWVRRSCGCTIDIPGGIPIPGKGENSYDQGEDAYLTMGSPATTVEEAIRHVIQTVNLRRTRYGGENWQPEGTP